MKYELYSYHKFDAPVWMESQNAYVTEWETGLILDTRTEAGEWLTCWNGIRKTRTYPSVITLTPIQTHVHFVGFRTDAEYSAAVRVWGKPDFVHMFHDQRMYGDIGDNDIVVLGSKGTDKPHPQYSWQDHELW